MDLSSALILTNLILTCLSGVATPIIIGLASFLTRITHSDCCCGTAHIDLQEVKELREFKRKYTENSINKNNII